MSKQRTHGVTHRGGTSTYHGIDATKKMAQIVASHCLTQKKAWTLLRDKKPDGVYDLELARWLHKLDWRIPQRFRSALGMDRTGATQCT